MPAYKVKVNATTEEEKTIEFEVTVISSIQLNVKTRMAYAIGQIRSTHPELTNPVAVATWNIPDWPQQNGPLTA